MADSNINVPVLKQKIKDLPNGAIVELLSVVVRECIVRKVFQDRRVTDIVTGLEAQVRGEGLNK